MQIVWLEPHIPMSVGRCFTFIEMSKWKMCLRLLYCWVSSGTHHNNSGFQHLKIKNLCIKNWSSTLLGNVQYVYIHAFISNFMCYLMLQLIQL